MAAGGGSGRHSCARSRGREVGLLRVQAGLEAVHLHHVVQLLRAHDACGKKQVGLAAEGQAGTVAEVHCRGGGGWRIG